MGKRSDTTEMIEADGKKWECFKWTYSSLWRTVGQLWMSVEHPGLIVKHQEAFLLELIEFNDPK